MAPFPGGVLMQAKDGTVLGAVGVSGAAGDEDEYCGLRGVIEADLDQLEGGLDKLACNLRVKAGFE